MKKAVLVAAMMLSACAAPHYVKEGVSQDQANRDTAECRYQAESAAAPIYDALTRQIRINDLVASCLESRGYRRGS